MRKTRIYESTAELDRLENAWWNQNADTIELIWANSYEVQKLIRLPYLKRARAFFQSSKKTLHRIWEVGCGSGWVCRLIADSSFHIIGTDFSDAQIKLAQNSAARFGKDSYCQYKVADASSPVQDHDGIFIHALLHHLSAKELEGFFSMLKQQRPGTKIFLYEPTFIQSKTNSGRLLALLFKQVLRSYRFLAERWIQLLGRRDEVLAKRVEALFSEADQKDWFLSPKEVPFLEEELDQYLSSHFQIHRTYFVNYTELALAQSLMIYQMPSPGFFSAYVVIPVAIFLDRIFFRLNFRSVTQGQYFYKCFELTLK